MLHLQVFIELDTKRVSAIIELNLQNKLIYD
jgi:hypothetical protein